MEFPNIRRLAVFKMRNIGDVLMMTPVLRALRETFPQAQISVVVNSGTEAMLAGNPDIDEVLVYDRREKGNNRSLVAQLLYEWHFLRELQRRKFDLTIGFTDGDRAAWYTLFCGARHRIGSPHHSWGRLDPRRHVYNLPVPSKPPSMHEVEKHFWILGQAGLKLHATHPGKLCLVVPEEQRAWARQEIAALRPGPVLYVHPTARWPLKCWDNASMAQVIDWLQHRHIRVVVNTGPMPQDRQRAQEIVHLCHTQPRFYDGTLSLGQTTALIAESDGYFGVDTAPMHIAAAVGVPITALFGPTGQTSWRPWSDRARILSHPCACLKKGRQECDWTRTRACLAAITPAEAQAAVAEMLHLPEPATHVGHN